MALVKWEPFGNAAALQDRINQMFEDTFHNMDNNTKEYSMSTWKPAVDIFENIDFITIEAELPGMKKEDVNVEVNDHVLTIQGEKDSFSEKKKENYYRKERISGKFHRAFTLPVDVDTDKITAKFKDGVLSLQVPKPQEKKPKKISVTLEG